MKFLFLTLSLSWIPLFQTEIQESLAVLDKQKSIINDIKRTSSAPNDEALSIVFPEMIRWSTFKNFFETSALETLYVLKGKSAADFSIGYFQMKPSFVEDLENYVAQHPSVSSLDFIILKEKTEKENRTERIKRLKQWTWQVRYAHVYWLVAQDVFKNKAFNNAEQRVHFFAAAYNYGFLKPIEDIEKWEKKIAFPYGANYNGEQIIYADLSVEFLKKYSDKY